jgi:cytochrome c oxidase subunit II
MTRFEQSGPWRILIASSHPLFAKGLQSLLSRRNETDAVVVGIVSTIEEALAALENLTPDLVIVDYDDERVNRDEFLARFVEGEGRLRVVLLSLREGGDEAIVYDRRTLAASRVEDWLEKWTDIQVYPERVAPLPLEDEQERGFLKRSDNMKHLVAAALVVIALTVGGLLGLQRINLLPAQASTQAVAIDGLFNLHFTVIVYLFALIVGLMIYSIIVFRRKAGDTTDAPHIEGSNALEVTWTIVPLVAVMYIAVIGGIVLGETTAADPRPLEVNVIGSQWSWRFEYPDLGINSTELILPADKQALLHLSSTDVIHSFWVPEFRVKQDALPGGDEFVRELRITPNLVGDYKLRCAEMCGQNHYSMESPVSVIEQSEFDAWVASQTGAVSDDPVVRGEQIAQQYGCLACHSTDGTVIVGPTWDGLFSSQEELEGGGFVLVDHDYLYESIRDPGAKLTAGFQNIMPANIAADMTDEQIDDVIAFIENLQ